MSDTGAGATSETAGTVTWTNTTGLANAATASIDIVATVKATGVYGNTATITASNETDPTPGNNTSTNTPAPVPQADLVTIKTDNQTEYTAGQDVVYTITVTNNGPSDAVNVKVVDDFPAGITVGKWKKGAGAETVGSLDDTTASLVNGASVTYTVTLSVPSSFIGNLVNLAKITSDTPDPDPTCVGCSDTNTPAPTVDVPLTVDTVCSGDRYQIEASATNGTVKWTSSGTGSFVNDSSIDAIYIPSAGDIMNGNVVLTITVTSTITTTKVTDNITLTINPLPNSALKANNISICIGENGVITLINSELGVSYQLRNNSNDLAVGLPVIGTGNNINFNVSPTATTTYNILATSATTCSKELDNVVTVTVNPLPLNNLTVSNAEICEGASAVITITNSEAGISYQLRKDSDDSLIGNALIGTGGNLSFTLSPSVTTVYNILATSTNNCSSELTNKSTITVSTAPTIVLGNVNNVTTCSGTDGSIELTGLATSTLYRMSYTKDGFLFNVNIQSDGSGVILLSSLTAGTYTNINVGLKSCTSNSLTGPIVVTEPSTPTIGLETNTNPTACAVSDGTITLNGLNSGASYDVNYNFNGTPTTVNLMANVSGFVTIQNLVSGNYTNISVAANSCKSNEIKAVTLSDPGAPTLSLVQVNNPPNCVGTGSANFGSLQASTDYTLKYSYNGVQITNNISTDNSGGFELTNLAMGLYENVTVKSTSSGCVSNVITRFVIGTPTISIGALTNPEICNTNGSFEIQGLGANSAYTLQYEYNGNTVTNAVASNPFGSILVNNLDAGNYTNITVVAGGCTSNALTTTITAKTPPVISLSSKKDPTSCAVSDGFITISGLAAGESYVISYQVNGGNYSQNLGANSSGNLTVSNLEGGTYSNIKATNSKTNCASNSLSETLVSPLAPAAPVASAQEFCGPNTVVNLIATVGAGLEVKWYLNANGGTSLSTTEALTTRTYYAETFNPLTGCASDTRTSVAVTINNLPAMAIASDQEFCGPKAVSDLIATVNAGEEVLWYTTATGGAALASNAQLITGVYYVSARNTTTGCVSPRRLVNVTIKSTPVLTLGNVSNAATCGGNEGLVQFTGLLASKNYAIVYKKNNISITSNITSDNLGNLVLNNLNAGSYSEFQLELAGCSSNVLAGPIVITQPSPPTIALSSNTNPTTCGASDGAIIISGLVNGALYKVNFERNNVPVTLNKTANSQGFVTLSGLNQGNYTNISVDSNGCSSNMLADVVLRDPGSPNITIDVVNKPLTCNGKGSIEIITLLPSTNYTVNYTYNSVNLTKNAVTDGTGRLLFDNLNGGLYENISVTTLGGCTSNLLPRTVIGTPVITLGAVVNPPNCITNGSVELLGLTANASYTVSYALNGTPITPVVILANGNGSLIIPNLGTGDYTNIKVTDGNGCDSNTITSLKLLNPFSPTLTVRSFTNLTSCSVNNGAFQLQGLTPNDIYKLSYKYEGVLISAPLIFGADTSGTISLKGLSAGAYTEVFVTNTISGCISNQVTVLLAAPAPITAPTVADQAFCGSALLADVMLPVKTGIEIKWYTSATGGSPISFSTPITTTTFYAEATNISTGCSSARTPVNITINDLPNAPVSIDQVFCETKSVSDLKASVGVNEKVVWYYTPIGGSPLLDSSMLSTGTYYAETVNTVTGCVSGTRKMVNVTLNNCSDLSLNKTINNLRPNIGDVVTFTINIANDGKSIATGVAVEDIVPSGYKQISNINKNGSLSGNTITWSGLTVPLSGLTLTYTAKVKTPTGATDEYKNIAQITASNSLDPDSTVNNDDGDQSEDDEDNVIAVPQIADLELQKSVSTPTANVGDVITFTLKLTNAGPDAGTNVTIADYMPIGFEYVKHRTAKGTYNTLSIPHIWDIGTIQKGEALTLEIDVRVLQPTGAFGEYFNKAEVSTVDQYDPDSDPNNSITLPVEDDTSGIGLVLNMDLAVTKTVSDLTPVVNNEITFTISLINNSTIPATNVQIEDILPSGYEYVSHRTSKGVYDEQTGIWGMSSVGISASETLTITVKVKETGEYKNSASLIALDQSDSNANNNIDSVTPVPVCLTIYNEFSPNNDGVNDFFTIDCIDQYPNNTLMIVNRWNNTVYKKKGYNNTWDGTSNGRATVNAGEKLPVGTYYYILDLGDGSTPKKGWIYINR